RRQSPCPPRAGSPAATSGSTRSRKPLSQPGAPSSPPPTATILHRPPLPPLRIPAGPGAVSRSGEILGAMPTLRPTTLAALAGLALLGGCERRRGCTGEYCGTMVIAATGEPDILLPPVRSFATPRDVTEPIFLKLADLGLSGNTVGDEDFQPQLAQRW